MKQELPPPLVIFNFSFSKFVTYFLAEILVVGGYHVRTESLQVDSDTWIAEQDYPFVGESFTYQVII